MGGSRGLRAAWAAVLASGLLCVGGVGAALAQQTAPATESGTPAPQLQHRPEAATQAEPEPVLRLLVPAGTPIEIRLDRDIRIRREGQPVRGRVVQPVYAFDKLVIPAGAEALGRIALLGNVSKGKRTQALLDANLTPSRRTEVQFESIILPGGKQIPIRSETTPSSGQVMQFISAARQKTGLKGKAEAKIGEGEQQAHQEWNMAMQQVKKPGKMHRLERLLLTESPVRPQYLDAGSIYFAELTQPLDFGSEPLTPELAESLVSTPPDGSEIAARLESGVSSATARRGDAVSAIVTQPLFVKGRLVVPQGSIVEGAVVEAKPARHLHKNGELRIVFHQLKPPPGAEQAAGQAIEGQMESVQAGANQHLRLDSEGGARATSPRSRYLATGGAAMLAAMSFAGDGDSDATNRAAGGGNGYRLIGIGLGLAIHSQPFGMAMGSLGAARSVYAHFIARGHEVAFPKDTAMLLNVGARPEAAPPAHNSPAAAGSPPRGE